MIRLEIDDEEKENVREFLQHCLDFLTVEVHHTDTRAFRDILKHREKVIKKLLEQLDSDTKA